MGKPGGETLFPAAASLLPSSTEQHQGVTGVWGGACGPKGKKELSVRGRGSGGVWRQELGGELGPRVQEPSAILHSHQPVSQPP